MQYSTGCGKSSHNVGYNPCFEKAQVAHVIETEARVEIAIQVEHALLIRGSRLFLQTVAS